jgi:molybdopterin synthase catalytic subunit/molybdopterin synthase sulfur carrier subunit
VRVRVLAFARLRELLGSAAHELELAEPATVADVWNALSAQHADIGALAASTRIARNGRVVSRGEQVGEGDELALLPPVGGG